MPSEKCKYASEKAEKDAKRMAVEKVPTAKANRVLCFGVDVKTTTR